MKIRMGFVSNSSSSSFCIFGTYMNESDLLASGISKEILEEEGVYDAVEKVLENSNLTYNIPAYSDYVYIGRSWSGIGDKETGEMFRENVKQEILKVFPNFTGELGTHEEAWHD